VLVSPWDDDDWVGTPPEGRYTRDRARPDFWRRQRPLASVAAGGVALLLVIVVILVVLG
jgi:hypothetical protein